MPRISWKDIFAGVQSTVFSKGTFMKKAALHTITLMHCKTRMQKFYTIYLVLTKEMAQKGHL